ncbi:MAG: ATP-dependent protease subunit HslV [Helicobacteraceae bacterium]|jgi:ATP-dependent HslUV protease subunit HslV|nr:ATP-dependent protease subunit HslV [Helicobacteraceae bacterium]
MHFEATTILAYRTDDLAVIGGDGQVTFANTIMKGNAVKIREIAVKSGGKVLTGFAGSTADAFMLFDLFEGVLNEQKGDLLKAAIAFAKTWRKDKMLRRLEAMMIVLNARRLFVLSGNGDVIEPEDAQIAAIGSGGAYALAAARALKTHAKLAPEELVKESLKIAGEICIYTNQNIKTLTIGG